MYQDFLPVAVFIFLAIILLVAPLVIQFLISPRFNKKGDKLDIYSIKASLDFLNLSF